MLSPNTTYEHTVSAAATYTKHNTTKTLVFVVYLLCKTKICLGFVRNSGASNSTSD